MDYPVFSSLNAASLVSSCFMLYASCPLSRHPICRESSPRHATWRLSAIWINKCPAERDHARSSFSTTTTPIIGGRDINIKNIDWTAIGIKKGSGTHDRDHSIISGIEMGRQIGEVSGLWWDRTRGLASLGTRISHALVSNQIKATHRFCMMALYTMNDTLSINSHVRYETTIRLLQKFKQIVGRTTLSSHHSWMPRLKRTTVWSVRKTSLLALPRPRVIS